MTHRLRKILIFYNYMIDFIVQRTFFHIHMPFYQLVNIINDNLVMVDSFSSYV
jgi:hypothetical protein